MGRRIFPVGRTDQSGIKGSQSEREELDVADASELRSECFDLGVE